MILLTFDREWKGDYKNDSILVKGLVLKYEVELDTPGTEYGVFRYFVY